MSIIQVAVLSAEREKERVTANAEIANDSGAIQNRTLEGALEKIAAFIPSEAIASYIGGFSIISPKSFAGKWSIFFVCALFIIVFMFLGNELAKKRSLPSSPFHRLLLQLMLAEVSFVAWVCAMPDTPFLMFTDYATRIGGFSAVILAFLIPSMAELFDLLPTRR